MQRDSMRGLSYWPKFFAAGADEIFLPLAGQEHHLSLKSALNTLAPPINPWDLELVAFHPLGTARMSDRARQGVVNPEVPYGTTKTLCGRWQYFPNLAGGQSTAHDHEHSEAPGPSDHGNKVSHVYLQFDEGDLHFEPGRETVMDKQS